MRRLIIPAFLMLLGLAKVAEAQQDPKFTHYMFNQVVYNPAFVGNEMADKLCANLVQHNQWLGFQPSNQDGSTAPITTTFNIHTPFRVKQLGDRKFGAGLIFVRDALGFQSSTVAQLALSYHHEFDDGAQLIGGFNFGINQSGVAGDLRAIDPSDPLVQQIQQNGTDMVLDFGLGALYRTDNYYVGFSTLHLPQAKFDWYSDNDENDNRLMRHYYINGGYDYQYNDFLELQGRTLLKFDRAKWQIDIGVLAEFDEKYWGGLNLRWGEGVMFLAGGRIFENGNNSLNAGLSYDLTLNEMQTVSNGTVELMLNYCFKINVKPRAPQPQFTPRFMDGYTQ